MIFLTNWRKRSTVKRRHKGREEKENGEDTVRERGERKNNAGRGSLGKADLGPPKATRPYRPNCCGKRQRP